MITFQKYDGHYKQSYFKNITVYFLRKNCDNWRNVVIEIISSQRIILILTYMNIIQTISNLNKNQSTYWIFIKLRGQTNQ